MLHGFPISARLPEDPSFADRFWYWHGGSGRAYIHSIYRASTCPPLPGAVYVVVRPTALGRRPVAVGRFPSVIDRHAPGCLEECDGIQEHDEIHVHLLARDDASARAVLRDLGEALGSDGQAIPEPSGFSEVTQEDFAVL